MSPKTPRDARAGAWTPRFFVSPLRLRFRMAWGFLEVQDLRFEGLLFLHKKQNLLRRSLGFQVSAYRGVGFKVSLRVQRT